MIIPFFPPIAGGGVYRPLGFVRHLEKHGWSPTVISPKGDTFWITDETLLEKIPDSVDVVRTETLSGQWLLSRLRKNGTRKKKDHSRSSRGFSFLRRLGSFCLMPDTYIGWYPFAVREGKKILKQKRFDAIYSTSPPETSHIIARSLHRASSLPWVADFRDPWMNLHLLKPPTPIHSAVHRSMEKSVCHQAGVIVTNRWHHDMLKEHVSNNDRLKIITNGYEREEIEAVRTLQPPGDRFRITHVGMLTQQRSAGPFLEGLKQFLDRTPDIDHPIEAVFLGPREDKNEAMVKRLGLEGVVDFRDGVSHEEALKLERTSHILLLIKHMNPDYRGLIPGKLFEYIGVGRPILALAPDGEAKDIVIALNRGEVAPQDDVGCVADKIELLYKKFISGQLEKDYDLTWSRKYEREYLAGELADFLNVMISRNRG